MREVIAKRWNALPLYGLLPILGAGLIALSVCGKIFPDAGSELSEVQFWCGIVFGALVLFGGVVLMVWEARRPIAWVIREGVMLILPQGRFAISALKRVEATNTYTAYGKSVPYPFGFLTIVMKDGSVFRYRHVRKAGAAHDRLQELMREYALKEKL